MFTAKGFSLVELLVSVLVLTFVILGASMLFTQAQWYHLGADKRSEIQDHARVVIETMERDMRMIGFGVPTGADVGGSADLWEALFAASVASIGFTADIDNGHTILTADATSTTVPVENATYYADVASTPINILLANNRKQWAAVTANGISGNVLTTTTIPSFATFTSEKSEIFTLERVFYRMTGDTNSDGVCDAGYPFCTIERQEFTTNDATAETAITGLWQTLGEKVFSLNMVYQSADGTPRNPSLAADRPLIEKIIITLNCRNRWIRVAEEQSITMTSHVLIRNRAL